MDRNVERILRRAGEGGGIAKADAERGFTTALWRRAGEISTADCRAMFQAAGSSRLTDAAGRANEAVAI